MVFEQLFKEKWIEKTPLVSFLYGITLTLVAFILSSLVFKNTANMIGIGTIFFIVISALPGINKLFNFEEREEADKYDNFFKDHETIIDFYIYFFLGVLLVFTIISFFRAGAVFSIEDFMGTTAVENTGTTSVKNLPPPPGSAKNINTQILYNNLFVLGVSFFLSFFYGSGALFIIVLNASIFASSFSKTVTSGLPHDILNAANYTMCNFGIRFLHTIPEVCSYFLVAIAGGVLSKVLQQEKFGSDRFKRVVKDSFILLFLSIVVLLVAWVVEAKFTVYAITENVCSNSLVMIIPALILIAMVVFELVRKEIIVLREISEGQKKRGKRKRVGK